MSIPYVRSFDGLRALAVCAVVAFHCNVFRGGWLGVDLFFVLSGYLITSIIVAEVQATGALSLRRFWARRAKRLLPAVGVLLAFVVLLRAMHQVQIRSRGVWGAVTYSTNWVQLHAKQGYWDAFATRDPLSHLWSLAVEEQFYLVWPVIAVLAVRLRGLRGIRVASVLGVGATLTIQLFGLGRGWSIERLYLGTDTRALAFLLGASASTMNLQSRIASLSRTVVTRIALAAVASVALIAGVLWLNGSRLSIFHGALQGLSLASMMLIVASTGMLRGLLTWRPLVAIGRWSYGIYLFHWPLAIASGLQDFRPIIRLVIVLGLSVLLAAASYKIIEMPIRRGHVGHAGLIAAIGFGLSASLTAGAVAQSGAPTLAPLPTLSPRTAKIDGPAAATAPERRLFVLGDSVPATASSQLESEARLRHVSLEVDAAPGCIGSEFPIDQFAPDICTPFIDGIDDRVAAADADIALIWFGGGGQFFQHDGVRYNFCSSGGRSAYRARLGFLTGLVARPGSKVFVVLPVPRWNLDVAAAAGSVCEADEIRAFADGGGGFATIDLTQLVCPSFPDDCQRVERPDGLHYSEAGATQVVAYLFDQLQLVG